MIRDAVSHLAGALALCPAVAAFIGLWTVLP